MVEKEPRQSRDSAGWAKTWDLFSERESLPPRVYFSFVDREGDWASSLCIISSCGERAGGSVWMYTGFFLVCVRCTKYSLPDKHREQVLWLQCVPTVVCVLESWSLAWQWWWWQHRAFVR